MSELLKVAVIGAGRMGSGHVKRLTQRVAGALVVAVVDVDRARAEQAAAVTGSAVVYTDPHAALAQAEIHAVVLATPGVVHRDVLLDAIERRLPVLCEKPLTADAASAWEIVEAEARTGAKCIQVGFMRRFDAGYQSLRAVFESRALGEPLMLHCAHRNPSMPDGFSNAMMIYDSVVHEFDGVRFFTGEEIKSVAVRAGKGSTNATGDQNDPQQILMETEGGILVDVEIFANAQFGYQVTTQAVFEQGIVDIGNDEGAWCARSRGRWGSEVPAGFEQRFGAAFDAEVQSWVDNLSHGRQIRGPTAWDGYAAAACCEAGVAAQKSGEKVEVVLYSCPELYRDKVREVSSSNL